ncbi:MAG: radical SAM protein, partial [Caldicoprobacteraceae bacterium]
MKTLDLLLEKLYNKNNLTREELLYLLENLDQVHTEKLFEYARKTRERYYGNKVYMRGLLEFSNICRMNCLYCGIRRDNKKVQRYRLSRREILECCREGYALGYRTFVLQSGEDPWYTVERLTDIITDIKSMFPDVAVTLSAGERPEEEYRAFFEAGAERYLLRHE